MTRFSPPASILMLLLLSVATAAMAADALNIDVDGRRYLRQELRLNEFEGSAQSHVTLDRSAAGDYLIAWDSRRQEAGTYGVYARRVDSSGRRLGDEFPVNLYRPSQQMRPALACDGEDAWFVWESWGQDGSGQAVLGRGGDQGETLLAEGVRGEQSQPVTACLNGRRLAVWVTPGDEAGAMRLAGRLFEADGSPCGHEFPVSEEARAGDRLPCVAATRDGFVVGWSRFSAEGLIAGIFIRRFDAAGKPLGAEIPVAPAGIEPSLDCAPEGGFVIAWHQIEGDDMRLAARRFDAGGAPAGEIFSPGAELPGWQSGVAVALAPDGRFAVAWNQVDPDAEDADIYARLYAADGRALGGAFRVNAATEGWQGLAEASGSRRLHFGADGSLAVAWDGDSKAGDDSAANLTLLMPEPASLTGRLALRARLAFGGLIERLKSDRDDAPPEGALPHEPPVFEPKNIGGPADTEPYYPGGPDRDEGWMAITNTGWTPPDPHCAVGPNHLMAMVNGGVAAYAKDGTQLWFDDISGGGGFWGPLGANSFVFDPEVIYDPIDQRFMVMACERSDNGHSYFLLGVSAGSDPTGNWYKYRLDVTSLAGNDIDSPNIAVDGQAIYLSADFFSPDTYLILIVDKSSVLGGGAAVTTHYLHTGSQSFGIPVQYDPAPNMYMIEAFETTSANQVRFYAIVDPLGAPSVVTTTLSVPTYWDPPNARSYGTSATITTFEARFWSCVYRNGSLWACHHIRPASGVDRSAARWYEFEMNGWPAIGTPTLRQWGESLPNNTGFATFNSITVNEWGDAAMCFAYSSVNDPFTMTRVARTAGDPLNSMRDPVFVKVSPSAYTGNRWGDYSASVVDPADNTRFWMIHEYAVGTGNWSTWVSNFILDLTAAPPVAGAWPAQVAEAFPNPSQGPTHLGFSLAHNAQVAIEIYDVQGRLVRRLAGGERILGAQELIWDGKDAGGHPVVAGRYLSRIEVDGQVQPGHRITILR